MPAFDLDPNEVDDLAVERARTLRREAMEPTWNAGVPAAVGMAAGAGITGGAYKLLDRKVPLRKLLPIAAAAGLLPAAWAGLRQRASNQRVEAARELIQEPEDDLMRHLRVQVRKSLRDDTVGYARRTAESAADGVIDSDIRRAGYQWIGFMPKIQIQNEGAGVVPLGMR